jgi:hypothetical protein
VELLKHSSEYTYTIESNNLCLVKIVVYSPFKKQSFVTADVVWPSILAQRPGMPISGLHFAAPYQQLVTSLYEQNVLEQDIKQ